MSLQSPEAASLVKLLTDSFASKHHTSELQSLQSALDLCLESVKCIQSAIEEYPKTDKEAKLSASSSSSLTSLSTDTLLEICSFADMVSKCMLRFTACSVHKAMMRCPLDLTMHEAFYCSEMPTSIISELIPLRYWKCLDTRADRTSNSLEYGSPIDMLDKNKCELNIRHITDLNLSLSELNSLGFDRSWTITGALFTDDDMENFEGFRSTMASMVKYDAHHSFKTIGFSVDSDDLPPSLLVATVGSIDESVLRGIENFAIYRGEANLSTLDRLSIFECFSSLRSLYLDCVQFLDELIHLSCLTNLEKFVTRTCESVHPEQDLDFLKPLTKLKDLVLDIASELGWKNASSISNLNQLRYFTLSDDSIDLQLSHLSCLTLLEVLDLDIIDATIVGGSIASLSRLNKLKVLELSGPDIHGNISSLMHMTNLQCLSLFNCKITGNISSFSRLTKLSQLTLNTELPLEGDIKVMSWLTKLNGCSINGISVHGDIAAAAAVVQQLSHT
jgi:hypothetical protein